MFCCGLLFFVFVERARDGLRSRVALRDLDGRLLRARLVEDDDAADDAAFVLSAVENARQGVTDTRAAAAGLPTPELRSVAEKIGRQQQATLAKLEALAKAKGWRLPQGNPERTNTVAVSGDARSSANFIVHQIASHQSTLDQFRAQLGGSGDAELKRALHAALPGYQKNLQILLGLKL